MTTVYDVTVKSGDFEYNDANVEVSLIIIGDKGSSSTITIQYPKAEKGKNEHTKKINAKSNDVGKIQKIKIAHDSKKNWQLDYVHIAKGDQMVQFQANRKIDGAKVFTELTPSNAKNVSPLNSVPYTVIVKTGDIQNAGTDANVRIIIYGTKGKTDAIQLKDNKDKKNKFERGKTDEFEISASDVGKINKINIGHDNKGLASAWFLDSVTVKKDKETFAFNANKWLEVKGDSKAEIELKVVEKERSVSPNKGKLQEADDTVKYVVKVKTGHVRNAGTDSTVSITIYGNKGKTDKIPLTSSKMPGKIFEKAKTDEFHIHTKNIGQITKINIGHDSDGTIKSWYLDSVVITTHESTSYKFVAKRWLDENEGDGKTWIDLSDEFDTEIRKQDEAVASNENKEKKNDIPKRDSATSNRKELKQYTKLELERLKSSLERESSKIKFPRRREHQPFVFNDLYPYYDTKQVGNLLDMPQNEVYIDYCNRITATGIVEPWVAHRMEHEVPISRVSSKLQSRSNQNSASLNPLTQRSAPITQIIRPNKSEIEGSTLTPRFPIVGLKKPKNMTGPFYVDDIDEIRKQLKKNFGNESHARQAEDKTRTVNDFYRMKLDHFHPLSKQHMVRVYHAYLDNTVGSKKALRELLNEEDIRSSRLSDLDGNRKSKSAVHV